MEDMNDEFFGGYGRTEKRVREKKGGGERCDIPKPITPTLSLREDMTKLFKLMGMGNH